MLELVDRQSRLPAVFETFVALPSLLDHTVSWIDGAKERAMHSAASEQETIAGWLAMV